MCAAVVNDLLFALTGLDAKYVQARLVPGSGAGGRALTFVVAGRFDPSLQDLVSRMLPFWCAAELYPVGQCRPRFCAAAASV